MVGHREAPCSGVRHPTIGTISLLTRFLCNTKFVYMKNVTITLPEDVAKWARVQAAKNDVSLSRMLADLLTERMQEEHTYRSAMNDFMSHEPGDISSRSPYPKRESVHER